MYKTSEKLNKDRTETLKRTCKRKKDWEEEDKENAANGSDSITIEIKDEKGETSKRICVPKAKPKPRVVLSRRVETQSISNFTQISSEDNTMRRDSAGSKFDNEYFVRNQRRHSLLTALETGNKPLGHLNTASIAQRIESRIFRLLCDDVKLYRHQCLQCSANINDSENREIRLNLLMGRLDPEEFAFMPMEDLELTKMIALRIRCKQKEERDRLKQLKQLGKTS